MPGQASRLGRPQRTINGRRLRWVDGETWATTIGEVAYEFRRTSVSPRSSTRKWEIWRGNEKLEFSGAKLEDAVQFAEGDAKS